MLLAAGLLQHTDFDGQTCTLQCAQAPAGDQRMRIEMPHQHPSDARVEQRVGAGRRAAGVTTRLERDRDRGTAQRPTAVASRCVRERNDLRMRTAGWSRVAATEHAIAAEHDRPHGGIREGATRRAPRLRERRAHRRLRFQAVGRRGVSGTRSAGGSSASKARRVPADAKNAA